MANKFCDSFYQQKMKNPGNTEEILKNIFYDFKVEALIGDLIDNGLEADKFFVFFNGITKRRYSRDFESAKDIKLENGQKVTGISINRDGLYDSLPEGLFHEKTEGATGEYNYSGESKKLRKEEKESRNFFLPFENEIFYQKVQLELEERKILNRFTENLFDEIIPEFWNFDKSLDRKYVSGMIQFLHFSHLIAGKTGLTANCLETIIDEKVSINVTYSALLKNNEVENLNVIGNNSLGGLELGSNFICGESFENCEPVMEFTIGPLKNGKIEDYLENGSALNFLKCFYNYFVPAGFEIRTTIRVDPDAREFVFDEHGEGPLLGFESVI